MQRGRVTARCSSPVRCLPRLPGEPRLLPVNGSYGRRGLPCACTAVSQCETHQVVRTHTELTRASAISIGTDRTPSWEWVVLHAPFGAPSPAGEWWADGGARVRTSDGCGFSFYMYSGHARTMAPSPDAIPPTARSLVGRSPASGALPERATDELLQALRPAGATFQGQSTICKVHTASSTAAEAKLVMVFTVGIT